MRDLGTFGGTTSDGLAINDAGQITGWASTTGNAASHAFLWDGTTMQDLGTFGGTNSSGIAINAAGQVTGEAALTGDTSSHAFLWDGATMQDFGTFGGTNSVGATINDSGQVAGYAHTVSTTVAHAFLWDGTAMRDLNSLIHPEDPLQPFVTLATSADINSLGQVVAFGYDSRTDESHAYVVSPLDTTPESFSFVNQTNVEPGTSVTSNAVTISGLEASAQISVTGGQYSVGCTGTFTASSARISDGETVCVRLTASSAFSTTSTATLNVGGIILCVFGDDPGGSTRWERRRRWRRNWNPGTAVAASTATTAPPCADT